jgi:hypothetical protein
MQLKTGARLRSVADSTEVVVVRAPADPVDLRCGGHPMVPLGEDAAAAEVADGFGDGTQVGKRYADDAIGIEVMCTKAGPGSLSIGADALAIKGAKPLPSSD